MSGRTPESETARAAEVRIRRLPDKQVCSSDFVVVDVDLPALRPNDVLVRNQWMSLDPYMRLSLTPQAGYLTQMGPGDVLGGAAVGIVEATRDARFPVGMAVVSQKGWRTAFVTQGDQLQPVSADVPLEWHLGTLGLTGVTAWMGIEDVLKPLPGETLFISGAAGAVGSMACQLAKRRGARVLASVSSNDKARWLHDEVGIDDVVNYRTSSVCDFLSEQAPDGLDAAFDNVGGDILDDVLSAMRPHGRIALCGAMAQYQTKNYRAGPRNFFSAIEKSLTLRGFNAFLLAPTEREVIVQRLLDELEHGRIRSFDTVISGIDRVPEAFADLFNAPQRGKLLISL